MERRKFLKKSTLACLLISLHPEDCLVSSDNPNNGLKKKQGNIELIENIRLLTSTSLAKIKKFYNEEMGLSILNENTDEITFIAGASTLTFVKIDSSLGDPWYHFAFNIPENKILKAREWQLQHTELIPTPKRSRDPKFPNDVRHFRNWNAHSVFFWDPAGNLLEYIARHDLKNGTSGEFTPKDILNISEIAFVVDDQHNESKMLGEKLGLEVYPKPSSFWWAMGDENGLLLCIPKRIWGENTPYPKRFNVYDTEATILGKNNNNYQFKGFPYKVCMKERKS